MHLLEAEASRLGGGGRSSRQGTTLAVCCYSCFDLLTHNNAMQSSRQQPLHTHVVNDLLRSGALQAGSRCVLPQ